MKLPLNITTATLYSDLSYKEFFATYNPFIDGQAYVATYSFEPRNFDFWSKLEPNSVLYVAEKTWETKDKKKESNKKNVLSFLKRFPLFEARIVPKLHTKAVFFYGSNRLLLGSENLYRSTSDYSELMIETTISDEKKDDVIKMAFRSLNGELLTSKHEFSDIRLDEDGYPYLPCHKEVNYWDLIAKRITLGVKSPKEEYNSPGRIYHLAKYDLNGVAHVLAFNGYAYSGDISIESFNWLIENCEIMRYSDEVPWSSASDLVESSPRKDYFMKYHPVASKCKAVQGYWLGKVKDIAKFRNIIEPIKVRNITQRKISRPK